MVKTSIKDKNNTKQYGVRASQANLIYFVQQHQQAVMAGIMSSIAIDMGYNVTDHTQFELSQDMKVLKVTELQPESPIVKAL